MPPPGPDFIRKAMDLAGDRPLRDAYLQALYTLALYQDWFTLDVQLKGAPYLARFLPGHALSDERAQGPRESEVMVIGKMPGKEDARIGLHFIGDCGTGQIFLRALENVGCRAEQFTDWYITSLLKFGHPAPHLGNTIPTDWIKDSRPLLYMELKLVKPKFILCLGSEAAKELLGGGAGVNNSVGKVFDYKIKLADGSDHLCKVMTCLNPGAVARSPDLLPQLESTLRLFNRLVNGEKVGAKEDDVQHVVVKTEAEAVYWIDKMIEETEGGGAVAVDCEWQGEYPEEPGSWLRTIQVSHKSKFGLCLVLRECGGGSTPLTQNAAVLARLRRLFQRDGVRPVGHFHRADLPWLLHYGLDIRAEFEAPEDPLNGWERTKYAGGFDTGAAAHAVCETDDFKLEVQATRLTGCPRYDTDLQEAKKALAKEMKIGVDSLPGYGDIPDAVLHPYACYDVDVTRRLFDVYNGTGDKPGLLDYDDYGNNSRMAFWISMRASPACLEMEQTGLMVDMRRAEALVDTYRVTMSRKVEELKKLIGWESFNLNSPFDCRELLFGVKYRGQIDKETGLPKRNSPETAKLCHLLPIKATGGKTKKSWEELEMSGEAGQHSPATDKETLGILFHQTKKDDVGMIVGGLRDIRFLGQLLKTTLRPPKQKDGKDEVDDDGDRVFEDGLLSYICQDYRIRTHLFQTLETGRYASARPNLQNISKRREADYKRITGAGYLYPLRSIFVAPPGHVLIEADYVGAELAGMAWMSGDPTMIEHVRRAQLPEDHPEYYDIHSAVAVSAFRLNCQPTKKGLESIGMLHLRVAAKNVVFGYAYGRGAEAICRQAKEEGVTVTVEEAQALIDGLTEQYPHLPIFFGQCRRRTQEPGWMCNPFGRFRRFRPAVDRKTQGEQERQAMNFDIQSLVADAMSRALDHLYSRRKSYGLNYKIALQIHDAVILEVPCEEAEVVYDKVLPECMTDLVDIRPCDLDGIPLSDTVYHLGIDREVYLQWGEKLSNPKEAAARGVPSRFVKAKKK
jgi:uracil-DNA glycosylase family 4